MKDVFQLFVLRYGLAVFGALALTGVSWIVLPRLLRLFRWFSRLGPIGAVVLGLGLTVAVNYGGEKNDTTNNPAPPTGDPPAQVEPSGNDSGFSLARVESWHLRGAWKDSRIVVFDEGWCFPFAFGHLASVELGSQGCVFASEQTEFPFAELLTPLALAPGETEVRYGRTSRNSYRFEWVNAHPNRDASVTANASIELFRNGDFETTEGGVTTRHSYEIPFPHDGFGQDDIWVRANFTNGAEIVSAGYADWVDDQIGVNLTNGLYKFTASFLSDPPEPTWLQVGDYSVTVTNAGDYAFVLEKGRSYDFGTWPHVEDVAYDMQDDLYGRGPLLMSALPHDDTQGRWTVDGGWHWLYFPYGDYLGSVGWLPTLRGSPDVVGLSADDFPKTFTAVVEDCVNPEGLEFEWSSANPDVQIASPHDRETSVSLASLMAFANFDLSVSTTIAGVALWSHVGYYDVPHETVPMVSLSLDVPRGVPLKGERIECGLSLQCDVETNGWIILECNAGADRISLWSDAMNDTAFVCSNRVESVTQTNVVFFVRGETRSQVQDDVQWRLSFVPDTGTTNSVSSTSTVFGCYVQPIMEVQISGQPRYYNPAYVAAGLNGRYRVDVMPSVPSSEIKWYVYDGEAQFPQGNTGSQVEITGQSGECEISIYVLGQSDERMRFKTEFVGE